MNEVEVGGGEAGALCPGGNTTHAEVGLSSLTQGT
jgi:hypothetical protein